MPALRPGTGRITRTQTRLRVEIAFTLRSARPADPFSLKMVGERVKRIERLDAMSERSDRRGRVCHYDFGLQADQSVQAMAVMSRSSVGIFSIASAISLDVYIENLRVCS